MTIEYQGRTFTVEATGNDREPYRLVGKRGGALTLARDGRSDRMFIVRTARGLNGGYVARLSDGRLLWLPNSGPQAAKAWRQFEADRAA